MRALPGPLSLMVLLLAACGDGGDATPSSDAEPRTTEPSAAPPSVRELAEGNLPLPPGSYSRAGFAPPITIELDSGWRAVQLFDGFFDVQQDVGSPDVIAVQFANVRGVYGAEGPRDAADPEEAVEILGTNPGLTVVESSESRIGGLTGAQATVENAGGAHAAVIDVPPGPLGIDPGRRLWIAFFETDDGLLAIMVGGSVERWEEALLTAEPVLESVEIGSSR